MDTHRGRVTNTVTCHKHHSTWTQTGHRETASHKHSNTSQTPLHLDTDCGHRRPVTNTVTRHKHRSTWTQTVDTHRGRVTNTVTRHKHRSTWTQTVDTHRGRVTNTVTCHKHHSTWTQTGHRETASHKHSNTSQTPLHLDTDCGHRRPVTNTVTCHKHRSTWTQTVDTGRRGVTNTADMCLIPADWNRFRFR